MAVFQLRGFLTCIWVCVLTVGFGPCVLTQGCFPCSNWGVFCFLKIVCVLTDSCWLYKSAQISPTIWGSHVNSLLHSLCHMCPICRGAWVHCWTNRSKAIWMHFLVQTFEMHFEMGIARWVGLEGRLHAAWIVQCKQVLYIARHHVTISLEFQSVVELQGESRLFTSTVCLCGNRCEDIFGFPYI